LVRSRKRCAAPSGSVPRVVAVLSTRIPNALQPVSMLVRDHADEPGLRRQRGRGVRRTAHLPCRRHGSTTVGDGGMVRLMAPAPGEGRRHLIEPGSR
jgi:hypothetical protein